MICFFMTSELYLTVCTVANLHGPRQHFAYLCTCKSKGLDALAPCELTKWDFHVGKEGCDVSCQVCNVLSRVFSNAAIIAVHSMLHLSKARRS